VLNGFSDRRGTYSQLPSDIFLTGKVLMVALLAWFPMNIQLDLDRFLDLAHILLRENAGSSEKPFLAKNG